MESIDIFEQYLEFNEYEKDCIQFLIHFFDKDDSASIHEFVSHSEFYYATNNLSGKIGARSVQILVNPEIYKKYYHQLDSFKDIISKTLQEFSDVDIYKILIRPDLRKFQILANRYIPAHTPWENINEDQDIMLMQLRTATKPVEYQNIGNTCRTIMQKISDIVFDPQKHTASEKTDVSKGKFKNRLHTYIETELAGEKNKKLRDFSLSIIDSTETSIDIANTLTHDLNANSIISEFSVLSTIAAINIVRIIEKNKDAN